MIRTHVICGGSVVNYRLHMEALNIGQLGRIPNENLNCHTSSHIIWVGYEMRCVIIGVGGVLHYVRLGWRWRCCYTGHDRMKNKMNNKTNI